MVPDETPDGPIVAWRWFRVLPGGTLQGAQRVVWPADRPMAAQHVTPPALLPPVEPPTLRVLWQATSWPLRLLVTMPLLAAAVLVAMVWPWIGVLLLFPLAGVVASIRGRRTFATGTATMTGTVLLASCLVLAEVTAAAILAGTGTRRDLIGNAASFVIISVVTVTVSVAYARTVGTIRPHHHCPARPARVLVPHQATLAV